MTDEEMVAILRGQMLDPASPTPSIEGPRSRSPDSTRRAPGSGSRVPDSSPRSGPRSGGVEPWIMVLDKHGIFTWGETARESYERMIAAVSMAEEYVRAHREDGRRTISPPPAW
jgi:rhamnose utilization protein RhaD (predicted bifunctional aldolase and dehydrogenase)